MMKKQLIKTLREMGVDIDSSALLFVDKTGEATFVASKASLEGNEAYMLQAVHDRQRDFVGYCCCLDENPARCFVRSRNDRLEICRSPKYGRHHAPDCRNWIPGATAMPARTAHVRPQRTCVVPLFHPATTSTTPRDRASSPTLRKRRGQSVRRTGPSTLAASLLYLIDLTQLNHYVSGQSSIDWSMHALCLSLALKELLPQQAPLQGQAPTMPEVVHPGSQRDLPELVRAGSGGAAPARPMILIGSVERVESTPGKKLVTLEGAESPIEFKADQWRYAANHSPSRHVRAAIKALGTGDRVARVVGVFAVTVDASGRVLGHRLGLCATTRELIPVESGPELTMANELVGQRREFIKDIYLPAGFRFRPDFRLLDVDGQFVIEVNGMDTPEYLRGKKEVEEYLEAEFSGCYVIWWACRDEPLPKLPDPSEGS